MFGDLQPNIVVAEGVLIGIEPLQAAPASAIRLLVHRGILLVAEDNAFAGTTLPRCLAALGALGLLLVAFQLPGSTRQTVINQNQE